MNLRPLTAGRSFRPTYTWMENRFQSGRKGRRTNVSRESSYSSYDSSGYLGQEDYERPNSFGQKHNYLPVPSGRRREESVVNIGQNDYRLLDEGEYAVTPSDQYDYPVTGCQVGEYKSSNTMYTSNSKNPTRKKIGGDRDDIFILYSTFFADVALGTWIMTGYKG